MKQQHLLEQHQVCTRKFCRHKGQPQLLAEFKTAAGRRTKWCRTCRQASAERNLISRKNKPRPAPGGYNGQPPARRFQLAHHHYLLNINPWHKFGLAYAALHEDESKFKLLRAPDGRPVARRHADLKPGEVSLVLE